jgi:parallel beta-helix repeat protein
MKKYILAICLVLLALPAWGAIYYVDCNADGDAGAGTGTGAAVAWKTIAKVNASSFSAGDSILFNKGCTWREQLTVPSSGSAGLPITFGAYGTGANPIISGAELLTPGTSWGTYTTGTWSTTYSVSLGTDGTLGGGTTDSNIRNVYTATNLTTSGTKVRFTFQAHSAQTTIISDAAIGERDGTSDDFVSSPTRITFDGGSTGCSIEAGATKVSDEITFTIDETKSYMVSMWRDGNGYHRLSYVNVFYYDVTNPGTNKSQDTTVSGMTEFATETSSINKIEVYNEPVNIWQATLTTEPQVVLFDKTVGTKMGSVGALASATQWFWASNVLYVYSPSDPDTLYTSPGIESGGKRNYNILISNMDYVTIDGITTEMATYGFIVSGTSDHIIVQNCTFRHGDPSYYGFEWYDDGAMGGSNYVKNCTAYNNGFGISSHNVIGTGSGTESYIQNCTVYSNWRDGILLRGNYMIAENNIVYGNGRLVGIFNGIHIYSNSSGEGTGDNNIVRYNIVYNQSGANNTDGAGIAVDRWCSGNKIYYNLVYNNNGQGIYTYDSPATEIYNNIVYGNVQNSSLTVKAEIALLGTVADLSTAIVKNNIAQATSANTYAIYIDAYTYNNTLDITNNDWYSAATSWYFWNDAAGNTLSTWNALTGVGTDLNTNPLLTATYKLGPGSPAIDAGVAIVGLHDLVNRTITGGDYSGNTRIYNKGVDMGAIEAGARRAPPRMR